MAALTAHSLAPIDWSREWLAPWRVPGESLEATATHTSTAQALQGAAPPGSPRFVPHDQLPAGEAYEAFIHRTGAVPTRDNLHDFFNGLVWLKFPQSKRRLNQLQAAEIARTGIGATRGPLRDALTLFDENGAVLDAPPALWQALVARDWHRLFITERALWQQARLLVFGHALMEKLVFPRKQATAHILRAPGPDPSIPNADAAIATALDAAHLATKPFVPLPVLGVPGWWADNRNFCFYDDPDVFRPRRSPE
ncbi:DUF3025 domain-containing protein [Variovorax rhizosphaerae]|uniref:DUF3025 domain-containing protein n=1 Tax=Variovorax rhizosphaerae TaxID=1836200 RepID=A0ABU8WH23_9BURK